MNVFTEIKNIFCSKDINLYPWPEELIEKIGCFLLNIVVNNAKIGYEGYVKALLLMGLYNQL